MSKRMVLSRMVVAGTAMVFLSGFGLADLDKKLTGKDCHKAADKKKCEKEQNIRGAAELAAIGLAAKLIHDMVIDYKSKQTRAEDQVVEEYKKTHPSLPAQPEVVEYNSSIKPGDVVKAGKEVLVESSLVVVPGAVAKPVDIQEEIEIYDNQKTDQKLTSLTKPVNDKDKKTGAFTNQFRFTLPVGMPQGVYPIKTVVLVNGAVAKPANNKLQLVLNIDRNSNYQIVAVNQ